MKFFERKRANLKKIVNNVSFLLLTFAFFLSFRTILTFLYTGPDSPEYPRVFTVLLVCLPPFAAAKLFPPRTDSRIGSFACHFCQVLLLLFGVVGFVCTANTAAMLGGCLLLFLTVLDWFSPARRQFYHGRHLPAADPFVQEEEPPAEPLYTLDYVDAMDGHTFEYFTADLLRKLGYQNVDVTRGSGDQGVDVLAEKDGIRYAFQCKCYTADLGNKPVQEVHAGRYIYQCHIGVVITNRYFTQGAKEAALATGILLWDRDKLRQLLLDAAQ